MRERPEDKKERARALHRKHVSENRELMRAYDRKHSLKAAYGMTIEDYDSMLRQQGGACAICRREPSTGNGKVLHVDHDHATGRVRGLLCTNCNTGLGHFRDSTDALAAAAAYLQAHR